MDKLERIKSYSQTLGLYSLKSTIEQHIQSANEKEVAYQEFLLNVFESEIVQRERKRNESRLKSACFPLIKRIEEFDFQFQRSISQKQVNRLLELDWIDKAFNLIFLGPPGVGKSHLAIALGYKAVESGYKVSFTTMDNLIYMLKTQEISRKSKTRMNNILSSSLVIIDEVGYLPINREEANLFFKLVSALHEQASLIITSNKGFEGWTELMGDAALATAVLDRLSHKCELFNMSGKSYRLEFRKSILNE